MVKAKQAAQLIGMPWGFSDIFMEMFRCYDDGRPMTPRSHCYASEIGGSFFDRYLKMQAHKFSNPYNERSKGKMLAGKFFEGFVKLVLVGTGILKAQQTRSDIELPGCLKVSGKLDFIAGGVINWVEARGKAEKIKELFQYCFDDLYPFFKHMTDKILTRFENLFGNAPLEEMIVEVKSVSGFVYELIKRSGKARRGHPLQSFHYLLGNKKIRRALLLYVSRESCEMQEMFIERTKELAKEYKEDVATMTMFYNKSIGKNYMKHLPPKDLEVIFEEATFRFAKNNKVEYSPYLTLGYGYKNIDQFKEQWDATISKWNRAFRRHVLEGQPTGKLGKPLKLSYDNAITFEEIKKYFPEVSKLVAKAKAAGAFEKPENDNEDE